MKKHYLLTGVFSALVSLGSIAQQVDYFPAQAKNKQIYTSVSEEQRPTENSVLNSRATGDTIWFNDFSTPSDWVIANESSNSDDWIIGTAGPAGSFPNPLLTSTSGGNNALFDSDLLCSGDHIGNITMANSVDLSAYGSVVLQFEQYYRRYNDSTFVLVSVDGTNWVKYAVNEGFSNNDAVGSNPDLAQVNITATAASQSTVWIRFQFWSPSTYAAGGSGPGCGYAWQIDDVAIVEGAANDLRLDQAYHGDVFADWEYAITPVDLVRNVYLGAIVTNFGSADETNVTCNYDIMLNGGSVNSGSFPIGTGAIAGTARDTGWYDTGYLPATVGVYTVSYSITSDATDENPADNEGTRVFETSQHQWSHEMESLWDSEYGGYIVPDSDPQEQEAYSHGSVFYLEQDADLYGLSVSFGSLTSATASVPLALTIEVHEIGANIQDIAAEIAVDAVDLYGTGWTDFVFSDAPLFLEAGKGYILAVSTGGGEDVITIDGWGEDQDNAAANYGPFGAASAINWFSGWDYSSAIRANFDPNILGVNEAANLTGIRVYPNPTSGIIQVRMQNQDSYTIEVANVLGELVYTSNVSENTEVNLNKFGAGVYVVKVSADEAVHTERVIVQ